VGDFNGDGMRDVVVANYMATTTLSLSLGNGHGAFGTPSTLDVGRNPTALVVGDFNGDGHDDIATANSASDSMTVLFGPFP